MMLGVDPFDLVGIERHQISVIGAVFHGAKREGTVTVAADGRLPPGNKLLR